MKIEDLKKRYPGDIKLGARDGAGFIYCGRLDKLDLEELKETTASTLIKSIDGAENAVADLKKNANYDTYERYAKYRKSLPSETGYNIWLKAKEAEIERKEKHIAKLKAKLDEIDFSKREILEIYRSALENALIVIIEGREIGKYWMVSECIGEEDGKYRRDAE